MLDEWRRDAETENEIFLDTGENKGLEDENASVIDAGGTRRDTGTECKFP